MIKAQKKRSHKRNTYANPNRYICRVCLAKYNLRGHKEGCSKRDTKPRIRNGFILDNKVRKIVVEVEFYPIGMWILTCDDGSEWIRKSNPPSLTSIS